MKITLQPSADQSYELHQQPTVSIEMPCDEIPLDEVISDLIKPALMAWGFHKDTIDKHFSE